MKDRNIWAVAAIAFAATIHSGDNLAAPPAAAGAVLRPNIIYILLDDAGYGDFACFGSSAIQTPGMARLCREGTRFTQHYSGSAVCAPSRCVLMTGLHTGHCRQRDNRAKAQLPNPEGLVFLTASDVTVAETLQKAGYVTGGVGKWALGDPGTAGEPGKHGFDHWFGYLSQIHAHDHFTSRLWQDGRMVEVPGNREGRRGTYVHDLLEEKTLEFIRRYRSRPFFLYLAYTLPHGKYEIPQDDPALEPYAERPWPRRVKNYAAMVSRVDRTLLKILDLLADLDLDRKTIVFYTSDNGPNPPFIKLLDSAGGLRGIKGTLYEGGIRAAMAVRWPGSVPAGRTSDFVWDMRDVFPTLCELAGVEPPAGLDGISVLPVLLGRDGPQREHLYWEYHSPFQQAVRKGRWKGIRFGVEEPLELYDLLADPRETRDRAGEQPTVVRDLAAIMDSSRSESPYWPALTKRAEQPLE